ncbi:hypothetical protein D3C87_278920 [compost metagenome]
MTRDTEQVIRGLENTQPRYGGVVYLAIQRLKQLEAENASLKEQVNDLSWRADSRATGNW